MTDREPRTARVDTDVWSDFVEWVEAAEGHKRGHVGRHVENALKEYIDHGREARIEEKVDKILTHLSETGATHTHTPQNGVSRGSESVERARKIMRRLQSNHGEVLKNEYVERAIEDIAGADDRTVKKYKAILRRRGLLFEHPGERPLWTTETQTWNGWINEFGKLNGPGEVEDELEPYPARAEGAGENLRIILTEVPGDD